MNFVEAAITLLREKREPMHVEELCRLALERELLSRPGANPLRSMKGRLTTESRRGGARVAKVDQDVWELSHEGAAEPEGAPEAPPVEAPEPAEEAAVQVEAPPLSPEERQLADLYADEQPETTPLVDVSEFRDEHTADEDRPMLPEIRAERRRRGGKERRQRRGGKERGERGERSRRRGRGARDEERGEREEPQEEAGAAEASLADRAYQTLAAAGNGQLLRARQVAQMMKRRRLLAGDPDKSEELLRAALMVDENERLGRGLRPRIVRRGRDRFALATAGLERTLQAAEEAVEKAASALEASTRRTLGERLGELSQPALERVIQLYLAGIGWTELDWIKRVGGTSYATALPPGLDTPTLIGTRVGKKAIDRRGVGELRAGLAAKGLPRGLLISPQPLSEEALSELEKEGQPVALLCGDDLLGALVDRGIGVVKRSAPLLFLDLDLLAELG